MSEETLHELRDRQLFDAIATKYVRKDVAAPSRKARKLRLFQTLRVVPMPENARILEPGCGAGYSAEYLTGRRVEYVGVDYSESLIEFARSQHSRPQVHFDLANVRNYEPEAPFDVIFMIGVLHHFDDMQQLLVHLVSLLKPGGWLVANEPQPNNPIVRFLRTARKRMDRSYSQDQTELTGRQLKEAYLRAGLEGVFIQPQGLCSTPFAEVVLKPMWLMTPLATMACVFDQLVETIAGRALSSLTWNVVCAGQKPGDQQHHQEPREE